MNAIDKLEKLKEFTNIYKEYYFDILLEEEKELCKIISEFLVEISKKEEELIVSEYGTPIKYVFRIVSRVKSDDSLYEKIIRKNLISDLDKIDLKKDSESLVSLIYGFDDIIGIRITTKFSLNNNDILGILKRKGTDLLSKGIVLDLDNCIDEMKNGLKIIKIKCKFNKCVTSEKPICFELQIKSEFDAIWGDMEHSLFYKDYNIYPEKDNNLSIMTNLGKTLGNIDDIIGVINITRRDANNEYLLKIFQQQIDKKYSKAISKVLGVQYNLQSICVGLFEMLSVDLDMISKIKDRQRHSLSTDFLKRHISNSLKNFIMFQENDFLLIIFEYLYFNLIEENRDTEDERVKFFQQLYINSIKRIDLSESVELITYQVLDIIENEKLEISIDSHLTEEISMKLLIYILKTANSKISDLMEEFENIGILSVREIERINKTIQKRLFKAIFELIYCKKRKFTELKLKVDDSHEITYYQILLSILENDFLKESIVTDKKLKQKFDSLIKNLEMEKK